MTKQPANQLISSCRAFTSAARPRGWLKVVKWLTGLGSLVTLSGVVNLRNKAAAAAAAEGRMANLGAAAIACCNVVTHTACGPGSMSYNVGCYTLRNMQPKQRTCRRGWGLTGPQPDLA
jgi:hypothetical protein